MTHLFLLQLHAPEAEMVQYLSSQWLLTGWHFPLVKSWPDCFKRNILPALCGLLRLRWQHRPGLGGQTVTLVGCVPAVPVRAETNVLPRTRLDVILTLIVNIIGSISAAQQGTSISPWLGLHDVRLQKLLAASELISKYIHRSCQQLVLKVNGYYKRFLLLLISIDMISV